MGVLAVTLGSATPQAANSHRPVFAPDGESIVFMSDRYGGDWELFRVRRDGSHLERLTEHEGWDGYADVSPDGRWLAFDRGDAEERHIMLLDLETGAERSLIRSTEHVGGAHWSPDGRQIAFSRETEGQRDVWLMDPHGGHAERLTDTPDLDEGGGVFSPDGRRLLVVVSSGAGSRIEILDLDGGASERVLESSGGIYGVAWSPDGDWIGYNDDVDGDQEVYLLRPGHDPERVTDNQAHDHLPAFSPDSTTILYTSDRGDGRERIIVRTLATGEEVELAAGH